MSGVLFLDFDGVLNSVQSEILSKKDDWEQRKAGEDAYNLTLDKYLMSILNLLFEYVPETKIVISSSWRLHYSIEEICELMKDNGFKYTSRIVDKTPYTYKARGYDIEQYCKEHNIDLYCIFDDSDDMLDEQKKYFVHVNANIGLTIVDVLKAVNIFDPEHKILKKYKITFGI